MIQIINGVYGYVDKDGIVRPKTEADAPFELTPEQESRLVRLGVAKYVRNTPPQPVEPEVSVQEENTHSLSDLSAKELRELGKDYGLTFKVGMSKAEMVQAIEEAEAGLHAGDDDNEPAPVFDASEAVQ